jgi:hypothetical protein
MTKKLNGGERPQILSSIEKKYFTNFFKKEIVSLHY